MKLFYVSVICLFIGIGAMFVAGKPDPDLAQQDLAQQDLAFLVKQRMLVGQFEEEWNDKRIEITETILAGVETLGVEIIDPKRFSEVFWGDLPEKLLQNHRSAMVESYRDVLTAQEIAALADFYRSEVGQALVADPAAFSAAELSETPLWILSEKAPEMEPLMRERIFALEAAFNAQFSMRNLAYIFELDGVVRFENAQHRAAVLETLRTHE